MSGAHTYRFDEWTVHVLDLVDAVSAAWPSVRAPDLDGGHVNTLPPCVYVCPRQSLSASVHTCTRQRPPSLVTGREAAACEMRAATQGWGVTQGSDIGGGTCQCIPTERDGYAFSASLSELLHDCIYTPLDELAIALGFLNILFWGVSQLPQLYQNYLRGNVQGLSLLFLLGWAVADTASLLGCMLTQQQAYMTFTSGYF